MKRHDQPVLLFTQLHEQRTDQRPLCQCKRLHHLLRCQNLGLGFTANVHFAPGQRGIGEQRLGGPALVGWEDGAQHGMALRQMLVGLGQRSSFKWSAQLAQRRNVVGGGIGDEMIQKPKPLFGRREFGRFALQQQVLLLITGWRRLDGTGRERLDGLIRKQRRQ